MGVILFQSIVDSVEAARAAEASGSLSIYLICVLSCFALWFSSALQNKPSVSSPPPHAETAYTPVTQSLHPSIQTIEPNEFNTPEFQKVIRSLCRKSGKPEDGIERLIVSVKEQLHNEGKEEMLYEVACHIDDCMIEDEISTTVYRLACGGSFCGKVTFPQKLTLFPRILIVVNDFDVLLFNSSQ